MRPPLNILIVEDSSDDTELLALQLRRAGYTFEFERVDSAEAMRMALARRNWDLVISDYVIPGFGGPEALGLVKASGLSLPFIIVSGHIGEDIAVAAIKAGADDYLMKDRLGRLGPAMERALNEAEWRRANERAHEALRHSEESLRQLAEGLEDQVEKRTAALSAANHELQRQMRERKRLENELLDIAENERRRIGFDLHDDIGQKLMGVSLLLRALEVPSGGVDKPGRVREARSLLEQVIHHTHNLAHCFSSLDENGADLNSLFKKLSLMVKKTFHISCRLSLPTTLPPLPADVTLQLYKIALESVSNAIRHAKATVISISVTHEQGRLTLLIKNDGVPFPLYEEPGNRLGMRIMNYRAHTIDAELDIRPNGDTGTIVTCTWTALAKPKRAPAKPALTIVSRRRAPQPMKADAVAASG